MINRVNSGWYTIGLDGKRLKLYTGIATGYNEDKSVTLYLTLDEWDELVERASIVRAQIELAEKLEKELEQKKNKRATRDLPEWQK